MANFRVDNMRILSAMADARRAIEGIPPLGAALAGVVNAASATGDAACAQRLIEWVNDRAGELIRARSIMVRGGTHSRRSGTQAPHRRGGEPWRCSGASVSTG